MKIATWLLALAPALACAAPHDADSPTLATAPREVLLQHFTGEVVRLWLRDRDCAARKHEVCRVDFAPIWDSQDPVGTTVKLRWDDERGRVVATLSAVNGSVRTLTYSLSRVGSMWRIADIGYGAGRPSLRQLLDAPPSR